MCKISKILNCFVFIATTLAIGGVLVEQWGTIRFLSLFPVTESLEQTVISQDSLQVFK